jgi:hypothetical protein
MEKILKALIAMAVLMLPWQYIYSKQLITLENRHQDIINMATANKNLDQKVGAQSMRELYISLLNSQKAAIIKERNRLELLMPSFSTARTSLLSPFELLRSEIPGEWQVNPSNKYSEEGPLVFWPFDVQYIGTAHNAIKAIAHMETSNRYFRIRHFNMQTSGKNVKLAGIVELVYQAESKGDNL